MAIRVRKECRTRTPRIAMETAMRGGDRRNLSQATVPRANARGIVVCLLYVSSGFDPCVNGALSLTLSCAMQRAVRAL
jgi:hypothetical protein